ncbi:MAG: DNA mismatch repair endonuclease MutL [Bauldia sp.]|uniref:DNA mismatch repair endonuclease MutL n=1 Tax=Bauldia sp. TaxID=2575872 RepID=UPI001D31E22D|nr:DNA mismatch repair endonuclease MutL [Bauldia sp.]MCB1494557.1 DNA mismatch repair endonuclease MutL [Bauldia sp.]
MPIRRLSEDMVNRIAAGEVVERPASVVKELVENAIDAGATRIEVVTAGGGGALIRVSDDGGGMAPDQLALAVERHCTSKLDNGLDDIRSLGFRGEALAAIGAAARLSVASRARGADDAFEVTVEGGRVSAAKPAALSAGTRIEVRDLFFATPARLKFLKSERAESAAITDVVKRQAMAHPDIRFSVTGSDRSGIDYPVATGADAQLTRLTQIMGADFRANAVPISAEREGVMLTGFAGLPTYTRANSLAQFIFVNGRPVRDKLLLGALRGAYADLMKRDRYPVAALFIALDPSQVDVNVHPAKADVRFRDSGLVRGLIVGAIRQAFAAGGLRSSSTAATAAIAAFRPLDRAAAYRAPSWTPPRVSSGNAALATGFAEESQAVFDGADQPSADIPQAGPEPLDVARPLGAARAQIHENYIVAQTTDGLVIVDQHAAHERLVYERLKHGLDDNGIPSQILLIPEVVDLAPEDVDRIVDRAAELAELGLVVERFGPGAIAVRETPSMLGAVDAGALVRDLAAEIAEWDRVVGLRDRLDRIAATMACYGSVRSGRRLKAEEMDALLREMEATPNASECNHGRPTYIELKLTDIERLFGRR